MSFENHELKDEFHMWMGYCIANWAKVEALLFQVFWVALRSPLQTAAIVYYRTPTVAGRLGLTDELVKKNLPAPTRPKSKGGHDHESVQEWAAIHDEIKNLLGVRSSLAHRPVSVRDEHYTVDEDSGAFSEILGTAWAELHVSETERFRDKEALKRPLILADLKAHRADTEFIRLRLFRFLQDTLPKHSQEFAPQHLRADLR